MIVCIIVIVAEHIALHKSSHFSIVSVLNSEIMGWFKLLSIQHSTKRLVFSDDRTILRIPLTITTLKGAKMHNSIVHH